MIIITDAAGTKVVTESNVPFMEHSITSRETQELMNLQHVHSFCLLRAEGQLQCVTSHIPRPIRGSSAELQQTPAEPAGGNCRMIQPSSQGSVVPCDHGGPQPSHQRSTSWDKFCSRH